MKLGAIDKDDVLYEKALKLRYLLFFKEHNLPETVVLDEKEEKSTHIAISQGSELIAYGRLFALNKEKFQISQMVVSPIYQSKGHGTKLLSELIRTAENKGAKSIVLNARATATGVYEKLGFKTVGDYFKSNVTGVSHIKMVHHVST